MLVGVRSGGLATLCTVLAEGLSGDAINLPVAIQGDVTLQKKNGLISCMHIIVEATYQKKNR